MARKTLRQTRLTILLSLNAVAIVIAGVMIAGAIGLNDGISFRVVAEPTDEMTEKAEMTALINSQQNVNGNSSEVVATDSDDSVSYSTKAKMYASDEVPDGELWTRDSVTMYETADFDLCVSGSLTDLGEMYWQTSNTAVISGFYSTARTWLGYRTENCRYPKVVGTGTTVVTAGTYDGLRHDEITVTVVPVPTEQWKREVLDLVNQERAKKGLDALTWGTTCEAAAQTRAVEAETSYSHTRPDGTSWSTACPLPAGGVSGENLAAGNAAVSPETVMQQWMNSAEHRANILNPNFTKLAVGFALNPNSQYRTYWSQYFSNY